MTTRTADERRADRFALLALAYTIAAGLALALLPTSTSTSSTTSSSDIGAIVTTTHDTLLENEGASVLVVLGIPALLALVAVVGQRRPVRMAMAGLLLIGCFLGAMSIGVFFLPAAALLLYAASTTPRSGVGPATPAPPHTSLSSPRLH